MTKPGRLYVCVDVDFFTCPEVFRTGRDAAWSYLELLAYSKRHMCDGTIPRRLAHRLGATDEALVAMSEVGWIHAEADTVTIVAWTEWNESKDRVQERSRMHRERQRKYRERLALKELETHTHTDTGDTRHSRVTGRVTGRVTAPPDPLVALIAELEDQERT